MGFLLISLSHCLKVSLNIFQHECDLNASVFLFIFEMITHTCIIEQRNIIIHMANSCILCKVIYNKLEEVLVT